MKRLFTILFAALLTVFGTAASGWMADSLGDGFEMRYVDQPADYAGPVRCTIVRYRPDGHRVSGTGVLYIHGYNDYFFQAEMARQFAAHGYDFYAVDLRKYGRSLMPGQVMCQVRDMREYFADIDSTLQQMHRDGVDRIVLFGHSTGGLTAAYYMSQYPDPSIRALMLNSPFLDWNQSRFQEKFLVPLVRTFHKAFPNKVMNRSDDPSYSWSLLKGHGGEWTYNVEWKRPCSVPATASWIAAIDAAQDVVQADPKIMVPILLMHSDRSFRHGDPASDYHCTDAVLDVRDIAFYGRRLGPVVTELTVRGGLHDLILSAPAIRTALYTYIFTWLPRHI